MILECTECPYAGDCEWCEGLPELLKCEHSHWLCKDQNAILFRGKKYNERAVNLIMQLYTPHDVTSKADVGKLYRVSSETVQSTADLSVSFWPVCES
jgi:hypothetical protein